ncbi:hypothetical protein J7L02_04320 [Candidatus Woesearchaeota archaeon]|nr:hypothetical protein [Candidatus Woesearchaeota archaeon]
MDPEVKELAKTLRATGFVLSEQEAIKRAMEIINSSRKVTAQQKQAAEQSLQKAEMLKQLRLSNQSNVSNQQVQQVANQQAQPMQQASNDDQSRTSLTPESMTANQIVKQDKPLNELMQSQDIDNEILQEVLEEPLGVNTSKNQEANQSQEVNNRLSEKQVNELKQELKFQEENTKVLPGSNLSEEERAALRAKQAESRVDLTQVFKTS